MKNKDCDKNCIANFGGRTKTSLEFEEYFKKESEQR